MSNKIKILTSDISNKIAAGEVVGRPLSVVKELIENAIDAKSSKIIIKLKNSGLEEIIVTDNGEGMARDDLELSILRHATSKIQEVDDVYRISTLGFRGEALSSIAAVSKFEMTTSTNGNEAYTLRKEAEEIEVVPTSANKGTTVVVRNLFFNTPARYKHLSSIFYELSLIVKYVNKISLTKAEISFELYNNDNKLFSTLGDGNITNIMYSIYSKEVANNLLYHTEENDNFQLNLVLVKPQVSRSRKDHIIISVNNRIVRNLKIENAVSEGYGKFLHTGQFPIAFIDIETDYSLVDINIHPSKEQIKISLMKELESLITNTITSVIGNVEYISKPEINKKHYQEVRSNLNKEEEQQLDHMFAHEKERIKEKGIPEESVLEKIELQFEHKNKNFEDEKKKKEIYFEEKEVLAQNEEVSDFINENEEKKYSQEQIIKNARFVGSHDNTYLLFENEEGLYFLDQHAAQERIRYEMLTERVKKKSYKYQQMLVPIVFSPSSDEFMILKKRLDDFQKLGLRLEEFGPNTIRLSQADVFYTRLKHPKEDIQKAIDMILKEEKIEFEHIIDDFVIMMSCKSSIKAHDYVSQYEAYDLLNQLSECKESYTCPHGRPVIVNISKYQLEKMFKRVF